MNEQNESFYKIWFDCGAQSMQDGNYIVFYLCRPFLLVVNASFFLIIPTSESVTYVRLIAFADFSESFNDFFKLLRSKFFWKYICFWFCHVVSLLLINSIYNKYYKIRVHCNYLNRAIIFFHIPNSLIFVIHKNNI